MRHGRTVTGVQVRPFPWDGLPELRRATLQVRRSARRALDGVVDPVLLDRALRELFDLELQGYGEIHAHSAAGTPPSLGADVQLKARGAQLGLSVEPALVAWIVSRAVGRPSRIDDGAPLDAALRGAWTSIVAELCRRAASEDPALVSPGEGPGPAWQIDFWVRVGGSAFRGRCSVIPTNAGDDRPLRLDRRSALPIALPVVVARVKTTAALLQSLRPGDALLFAESGEPGQQLLSHCELCSEHATCSLRLEQREGGLVLLGVGRVDYEVDMTSEPKDDEQDDGLTIEDAIVNAPVEVRIELGAVTLSAAQWLQLRPGDVVTTDLPVGCRATLRVGGKAVANGSLVNVEGQLGVKIEQLAHD